MNFSLPLAFKNSNMGQPKVSIIVPCWGVEKYLDRCVMSLVSQTLQDIEIILVDDVSPDKVPEMCDEWAKKDSRIKVIHKVQNEGLGMACNTGIDAATGKYIAFCDSDDSVEECMYEDMYNAAETHSADIVFTGLHRINDDGKIIPLSQLNKQEVRQTKKAILELGLDMIASAPTIKTERRIPMSAKIVLYKTNVIVENNLRFESERRFISEDLLWNLDNIAHANGIVILPKTYYNYFDNQSSITNQMRKDRFPMYKKLWTELHKRTEQLGYPSDVKQRIDRLLIGYCRHRILLIAKSTLTRKEKLNQIKEVCNDHEFQMVLASYPTRQMPFVHRIVCILIKLRASRFLSFTLYYL